VDPPSVRLCPSASARRPARRLCPATPRRAARPAPCPAPTRPTRAAPPTPRRYTPGRKEPQLSEARLRELNAELEVRLVRDAEASLARGACSGRGFLTPAMPWKPKGPNRKVNPSYSPSPSPSPNPNPNPSPNPNPNPSRKPTQVGEPVCHCLPGWFGEQCEWGPGHPALPESKQFCVHGCSGRGVCKLNWCRQCATSTLRLAP
jgi:hypothetical protein